MTPDFSQEWLPGEREAQDIDVGIPNVDAILWYHQQQLWQWRLDHGCCPDCCTPLVEGDHEEYCPNCGEG